MAEYKATERKWKGFNEIWSFSEGNKPWMLLANTNSDSAASRFSALTSSRQPRVLQTTTILLLPSKMNFFSRSDGSSASTIDLAQKGLEARQQLKDKIKSEYEGRVYKSRFVLGKVYNLSLFVSDFEPVIVDCLKKFRHIPGSIELAENDPRDTLVYMLNGVKESLKEHGLMEKSIYSNVWFQKNDEDIVGGISGDTPLRPGVLARASSQESPQWEDVQFCVEVDDNWKEMLAQGGVYAKCMTVSERSRRFLTIIYYQPNSNLVFFGLFSAAWLCITSTPYNILTEEGQRGFIADMAKIWSCTNRWDAGYDTTVVDNELELEEYGKFAYEKNLFFHNSLGGRRTRVDRIVAVGGTDDSTSTVQPQPPPPPATDVNMTTS